MEQFTHLNLGIMQSLFDVALLQSTDNVFFANYGVDLLNKIYLYSIWMF